LFSLTYSYFLLGEKLVVQGSKLYLRNNDDHQLVQIATPPRKSPCKTEGKKRNVEKSKIKKDPIKGL
jgi:hypothetical protein